MVQEIEMTKEEQMTMYMKCSKKELCEMLIEANRHLKNLPIHVVTQQSELVCDCLPMSTQVSTINGRYICCTCNKPLLSQTCG